MLFTEMNQGLFATPEAAPYASLKNAHGAIKQEVTLLTTALDALNVAKNSSFDTSRERLEHGKKLLERYDNIRDNDNSFMLIRDNIFPFHAYRIALTFARLSVAETLALLKLNQMKLILDAPISTFNALSFGLLGCRLLINIANAFKHAFLPTELEKTEMSSGYERFFYELDLNQGTIINDIIWASANALTNYPQVFGLSAPAANLILLTCLTFDFASSWSSYTHATAAYITKKDEYNKALASMRDDDINHTVIMAQLTQLELNYCETAAKFQQFLLAGAVVLTAFALIASSPLPFCLPLGAALCVVGTALYLSADSVANYKKNACISRDTPTPAATQKTEEAYYAAWSSFIKNTAYPLLLMMAAANLGWPLAIGLVCIVGTYEAYNMQTNSPAPSP